jgi:tRNA (mo5U34)-methyltransferase
MVIGPGKSDILEYYAGSALGADLVYVVQPRPAGLCDALFRALPLLRADDQVLVGLPDTVWFPAQALSVLPDDELSFLLFSVDTPQLFDAVIADEQGRVKEIEVKKEKPKTSWVWGAFKLPGSVLAELSELFQRRGRSDQYIGTLVNAYLAGGGRAGALRGGEAYVDVGTLHGYREAQRLLHSRR